MSDPADIAQRLIDHTNALAISRARQAAHDQARRVNLACLHCGEPFEKNRKFCDLDCSEAYERARKLRGR